MAATRPEARTRLSKAEIFVVVLCFVCSAFVVVSTQSGQHRPGAPATAPRVGPAYKPQGRWTGAQICSTVDVVYTWVNGSDPAHRAEMRRHGGGGWDGGYRDYGVIKYSARSVAKFMPWVRNIVLVTNGQVPDWVDPAAPRLRLVTHKDIFENPRNLPTFNSNAIEANLRNIPGIAPCFLYLNDDMFLGAPIPKDLFFDEHGNLKLHMSQGFTAPMVEKMKHNIWHRSVGTSNDLLNSYYHPDAKTPVKHSYVSHTCYFMRTDVCFRLFPFHHHIMTLDVLTLRTSPPSHNRFLNLSERDGQKRLRGRVRTSSERATTQQCRSCRRTWHWKSLAPRRRGGGASMARGQSTARGTTSSGTGCGRTTTTVCA